MRYQAISIKFSVALTLLICMGSGFAATSARLERTSIHSGEAVRLTIETDGQSTAAPDLSALGKDFVLSTTSQGRQTRIINGSRSDSTEWQVTLEPRRTGSIEIPAIAVGNQTTEPLMLSVAELPADALGGPGDDLFIEVEVGAAADSLVVQQQIPLTLRLFSAVPLRGGRLGDPHPRDAVVERLGDDLHYRSQRQGRDYQVIERRYALFPEHSGTLSIPPVQFEGRVAGSASTGPFGSRAFGSSFERLFQAPLLERMLSSGFMNADPFGMFDRGEPPRARSAAVELEIEPAPDSQAGHWLPAQSLTIDDSWADGLPRLKAGEPAERRLTIRAKGLAGSQIPTIELETVPGLRSYPGETRNESRTDGEVVYGISEQRTNYIAAHGGEIRVPAIEITWWDTDTGRERVASVPGHTLNVEGLAPVRVPTTTAGSSDAETTAVAPSADQGANAMPSTKVGYATAAIGLATLLVYYLQRRRRAKPETPVPATAKSSPLRRCAPSRRALRDACGGCDPRVAADLLLQWARFRWPDAPREPCRRCARSCRRLPNLSRRWNKSSTARKGGTGTVMRNGLHSSPT